MSIKLKIINKTVDKNFFCQICSFPLKTFMDFESEDKYNCCHHCYLEFVEARKQKWEEGCRPKRKEVDSYIRLRKRINLHRR